MPNDSHLDASLDLVRALIDLRRLTRYVGQRVHRDLDIAREDYGLLVRSEELGPVRIADLAHAAERDQSVISRRVAVLVDVGLMQRESDPDDGRAVLVGLTDAGQSALDKTRVQYAEVLDELTADWQPEDLTEVAAAVSRLTQAHRPHQVGVAE